MEFKVAESDGTNTAVTTGLSLTGAPTTDGVVNVTIGAGASSVTTIAGDLTVSGATTTVSSTVLEVTDDLITVSKNNDTLTNASGSGVEIDVTAESYNLYWKYVHGNTAWTSNVDIDTATTSDVYKIAGTSVLTNNTLGSGVVTSSLTTVGALNAGSITSGFTSIDVGSGAVSTSGTVTTGALTIGGDIGTAAAQDWDLVDDTASALSFDAPSAAGILEIDTQDGEEGVNMSGHLLMGGVAFMDTATGTITDGAETTIFSWTASAYSAAKFIISVWRDATGEYRNVTELLCTYDGDSAPGGNGDINLVEYAMVEDATGGSLGAFDVDQDGSGGIDLKFDPDDDEDHKWRLHATLLAR